MTRVEIAILRNEIKSSDISDPRGQIKGNLTFPKYPVPRPVISKILSPMSSRVQETLPECRRGKERVEERRREKEREGEDTVWIEFY